MFDLDKGPLQNDADLLRAIRAGDPSACTAVFETYADRIYRLALGLLKNPAEAEDVVQETCLKGLTRLKGFEGRSSIGTWLYRVAYNASADRLRRKEENPLPTEDGDAEDELPLPMPQNFVEWQTPEAFLEGAEEQQLLAEAVGNLPQALHTVFLLRDIEGLSTAETAEVLGIGEPLVKVRLHRARLLLREKLALNFGVRQTKGSNPNEL
jgi:RNA polymerase sigma-70 factor (ECF subfamily)